MGDRISSEHLFIYLFIHSVHTPPSPSWQIQSGLQELMGTIYILFFEKPNFKYCACNGDMQQSVVAIYIYGVQSQQ